MKKLFIVLLFSLTSFLVNATKLTITDDTHIGYNIRVYSPTKDKLILPLVQSGNLVYTLPDISEGNNVYVIGTRGSQEADNFTSIAVQFTVNPNSSYKLDINQL